MPDFARDTVSVHRNLAPDHAEDIKQGKFPEGKSWHGQSAQGSTALARSRLSCTRCGCIDRNPGPVNCPERKMLDRSMAWRVDQCRFGRVRRIHQLIRCDAKLGQGHERGTVPGPIDCWILDRVPDRVRLQQDAKGELAGFGLKLTPQCIAPTVSAMNARRRGRTR